MFILGLDLGQSQDYTAVAIIEKLEQEGGAIYHVRRLERTRGTPYPKIIDRVEEIMSKLSGAVLVVDQTGCGAPVVDSFRQARLKPIGIMIHGGDKATHEGNTYRVPKRDLVGVLQVLLQNRRLLIAPGPLSDILATEMLNFKVKIDLITSHDSYSAWREADHDDLILAVALAVWWAENLPAPSPRFTYPEILLPDSVPSAHETGYNNWLGPSRPSPYRDMKLKDQDIHD